MPTAIQQLSFITSEILIRQASGKVKTLKWKPESNPSLSPSDLTACVVMTGLDWLWNLIRRRRTMKALRLYWTIQGGSNKASVFIEVRNGQKRNKSGVFLCLVLHRLREASLKWTGALERSFTLQECKLAGVTCENQEWLPVLSWMQLKDVKHDV